MSNIAIRVEGLSKLYHLGPRQQHMTLRDTLVDTVSASFHRMASVVRGQAARNGKAPPSSTQLWALKDIAFEVEQGEVLGIIGRNGAGKSTLLKILSGITEPTEGSASIYGRVASLLEVGTGFHPELTGRENIYLNGAILGMRKAEIERKFDEIVAFAETERFLDTPVKHYSSGMFVRLAFAVAAHLEPEILVVDEVLAVGDATFQKKCLGKMADVSREGRTVLFVSHNMSAIHRLCSRCLLLEEGKVVFGGTAQEAVARYMTAGPERTAEKVWTESERISMKKSFLPLGACVRNSSGEVSGHVFCTEPVVVEFDYLLTQDTIDLRVGVIVFTALGEWVFLSYDKDDSRTYVRQVTSAGRYRCIWYLPPNLLNEGRYVIGLCGGTGVGGQIWGHLDILSFSVAIGDGVGSHWPSNQERLGPIRPLLQSKTIPLGDAIAIGEEDPLETGASL